jgi:flagellar biosynthesis/type III secretory pathway protein FliH
MKAIRLTKHAQQQCIERGTNEQEITEAIQNGTKQSAKQGREKYQIIIQTNSYWQGKYYSLKKVAPIVIENQQEIIVITVYTYYF